MKEYSDYQLFSKMAESEKAKKIGEVAEEYVQRFNRPEERIRRRELRKHATSSESTLWLLLKNRQLDGYRWRRQFSVGSYVLDFYCPELKLAIEMDGQGHFTHSGADSDLLRDRVLLQNYGIRVLRYENKLLWNSTEELLRKIKVEMHKASLQKVKG